MILLYLYYISFQCVILAQAAAEPQQTVYVTPRPLAQHQIVSKPIPVPVQVSPAYYGWFPPENIIAFAYPTRKSSVIIFIMSVNQN
jgi:hypothetical protein